MTIDDLGENWDALGRSDPMWVILTDPSKRGNKWQAEEFFATGVRDIHETVRYAESLVPFRKGRALDFGCGIGRLTQALANYFDRVDGVDISRSMIEAANRHNKRGDRCRYHLNRTASLELFERDAFDFVLSFITLQHIEPAYSRRYIADLVRVLAPGGCLVFGLADRPLNPLKAWLKDVVPDALLRPYRAIRDGGKPAIRMYGMKPREVIALLTGCGAAVMGVDEFADRVQSHPSAVRSSTFTRYVDKLSAPWAQWHQYRYCCTK